MSQVGQNIGPYRLLEKLGAGGFGEVWLAERQSEIVTKRVAVKLPHDDQIDLEAIKQEASLWELASGHPNVLSIIDADIYDGQVVIVSEYADGGSLHDRLEREKKLPLPDAVETIIGILKGLEFLHSKRIIHRDIKPQNILIQGDTPRLADFGISRAIQTTAVSSSIVGTEAYMAPEAFEGKRSIQTDIWSVGVVLFQVVSGMLPYPQENPSERMYAILEKEMAPVPADVPPELTRIISKALQKQPELRYQTTFSMCEDLEKYYHSISSPGGQKKQTGQRYAAPASEITKIGADHVPEPATVPIPIPQDSLPASEPEAETVVRGIRVPVETERVAAPAFTNVQPKRSTGLTVFLVIAAFLALFIVVSGLGVVAWSVYSNRASSVARIDEPVDTTEDRSDTDATPFGNEQTDLDTKNNNGSVPDNTIPEPSELPSPVDLVPVEKPTTPTPTRTPKPTKSPVKNKSVTVTFRGTVASKPPKPFAGASIKITAKGKTVRSRTNGRGIASFRNVPCGSRAKITIDAQTDLFEISRTVSCTGNQTWHYSLTNDGTGAFLTKIR